jgi:hypothetical protein
LAVHSFLKEIFTDSSTAYKVSGGLPVQPHDRRELEGITMRIEQNRANAQHSTGPTSEEGKAKSSRNATRHGLTGKQVVINGESHEAYEALRQDLIASYKPVNAAEAMLVEEIAQGFWRLQRARALEAEQFNLCCGGADPIIGFNSGNADFERLRRYMTSIERAYHRAIEQLGKTQSLRAKTPTPPPPTVIALPSRDTKIGFVSQSVNPPENRVVLRAHANVISMARAA